MKDKLKTILEQLDYGMTGEAASGLRELESQAPGKLDPIIEQLDLGSFDGAASLLRNLIESM